ncbi:MAG: hypothetical protein LUG52_01050 [Clostridia bacterium]|nr:hypothetical protein [Clostridia bacterium]
MNIIGISPFTPLAFLTAFFMGCLEKYALLYALVFAHEVVHFLTAWIMGAGKGKIHLLPWGCMLSLSSPPAGIKGAVIFASGPLFNAALFLLGIFKAENAVLAAFNLLPIRPLDGGMIVSLLFPKAAFWVGLVSCAALFEASLIWHLPPLLPVVLLILLFSDRLSINGKVKRKAREMMGKE